MFVSGVSSMYNVIIQYLYHLYPFLSCSVLGCSIRNLTLVSLSSLFAIKIDVFSLFTSFSSHSGL